MTRIAIETTYDVYIANVPEYIAKDIKKYQRRFDKWLYDKSNNHGLWVVVNGKKMAVSFGAQDFVNYLNEYVLQQDDPKCLIIDKNPTSVPTGAPTIWF